MKRIMGIIVVLLAGSLFVVSPAVASGGRDGGYQKSHGVKKEHVVVHKTTTYKTTHDRHDSKYQNSRHPGKGAPHRNSGYQHSRYDKNQFRYAPRHGHYKSHRSHQHQPKVVVKHRAPVHKSTVIVGVPSIVIRIGF